MTPRIRLDPDDRLEIPDFENEPAAEGTITTRRREVFNEHLANMKAVPALWKLSTEFLRNYFEITVNAMCSLARQRGADEDVSERIKAGLTIWLSGGWDDVLRGLRLQMYGPNVVLSRDVHDVTTE